MTAPAEHVESLTPLVIKPKGCVPDYRGMNTTATALEARTRNLARLRKLTIGTAALSVAATSGFGWLAAMSTVSATNTTAYTTKNRSSSTTSSSTTAKATAAPRVSSVSGTVHVSSGGS
jgi:hypothetical protein